MDYLEPVSLREGSRRPFRSGENGQVVFNCEALWSEPKLSYEVGYRGIGPDLTRLAIDDDFDFWLL